MAGAAATDKCMVSSTSEEATPAGQSGSLVVTIRDKYGNFVPSPQGSEDLALRVTTNGPAPLTVSTNHKPDGTLEVLYCGNTAGDYEIALTNASTGAELPGGPVVVKVWTLNLKP